MSNVPNPIPDHDHLDINSKRYYFKCNFSLGRKSPKSTAPSIQLELAIWDDTDKIWIDWKDFNKSYLEEKITDYVMNTLNGQRRIYWDKNEPRSFIV